MIRWIWLCTIVAAVAWTCCPLAAQNADEGATSGPAASTKPDDATQDSQEPVSKPASADTAEAATEPSTEAASEPTSEPAEEAAFELPPYYQLMVSELKLTSDQEKLLTAKVKDKLTALADWTEKYLPQRQDLQQVLVEARRDGNKEAVKDLTTQLEALSKQRRALLAKHDGAIMSILTPKQKSSWEDFELFADVMTPYVGLNLSDKQLARARNLCSRASAKLRQAKGDKAACDKLYDELYKAIPEKVLTPEQRIKLTQKPSEEPAKDPHDKTPGSDDF